MKVGVRDDQWGIKTHRQVKTAYIVLSPNERMHQRHLILFNRLIIVEHRIEVMN